MKIRFYTDPETNQPHIFRHDVAEAEVEDVLSRPLEDRAGAEGSRVALGQTRAGRYLRVIYVPDPEPDSIFVITAYDLGPKAQKALRRRRIAALAAPPLLIASTYHVFQALVGWLGVRWGYLGGFLFFWGFWCVGFSLWAIGREGIAAVLRDARPRLPRPAWLWLALLVLPVAGGFATVLLPALPTATLTVVAVAWLIAAVNATAEEVLWRGVYVRLFPGRLVAGWLYPAALFALWHISPTSIRGSAITLVSAAAFLGLLYGWIAFRTGSIRYTIPAHIAVNAMGLSFAILLLGH